MPHPPFHMEMEGGAKVLGPQIGWMHITLDQKGWVKVDFYSPNLVIFQYIYIYIYKNDVEVHIFFHFKFKSL
jgi:hypothetical protein